jgi:hypothetical protein
VLALHCLSGCPSPQMSSTAASSRPVRSIVLTAKLKDTSNASTPELSFQRKAVQDFRALQGQASLPASDAEDPPRPPLKARSSLSRSHLSLSTASSPPQKRTVDLTTDNSDGGDEPGMQHVFVSNTLKQCSINSHRGLRFRFYSPKAACYHHHYVRNLVSCYRR